MLQSCSFWNVEYFFITITFKSILIINGSTHLWDQVIIFIHLLGIIINIKLK